MNQQALEKYFWGGATYLRGHIGADDCKQFIFPLLFFKRSSDVYDAEYAEALKERHTLVTMCDVFRHLYRRGSR